MLIVSKERDYYDSIGHTYGIDKSVVYKREAIKLRKEQCQDILEPLKSFKDTRHFFDDKFVFPSLSDGKYQQRCTWYGISFCGKMYLILEVVEVDKLGPETYGAGRRSEHSWFPQDEILRIINDNNKGPGKTRKWKGRREDDPYTGTLNNIDNLLKMDFSDVHFQRKVPYFVVRLQTDGYHHVEKDYPVTLNPLLSEYSFYLVKDTFSAFQEVQQYISGVIGVDTNEPVVTDDKYKIMAHGFDLKTSFRKDAGKPRPRKGKA